MLAQLHSHGDQKTLSRRHHAAEEGAIHGAERARKRSEDHVHALGDVRAAHVEQVAASGVEALGIDQVAVDARLEVGELEVRRLQRELHSVAGGAVANKRHRALREARGATRVVVRHLLHETRDGFALTLRALNANRHIALHVAEVGAEERQQVRRCAALRDGGDHVGGDEGRLQRNRHLVGGFGGNLLEAHHHRHSERGRRERRSVGGQRRAVHHARLHGDGVEEHQEGALGTEREVVRHGEEHLLAALQRHGRLCALDDGGVVGEHERRRTLRLLGADVHRPGEELTHAGRGCALNEASGHHATVARRELGGGEAVVRQHRTAHVKVIAAQQENVAAASASAARVLAEDLVHDGRGVRHREQVLRPQPVHLHAPLHRPVPRDRPTHHLRVVHQQPAQRVVHVALLVGVVHGQQRGVAAEVRALDRHVQSALRGKRRVARSNRRHLGRAVDALGLREHARRLRANGDPPLVLEAASRHGDAANQRVGENEVAGGRDEQERVVVTIGEMGVEVVGAQIATRHVHHLTARRERVGGSRSVDARDDGRVVRQR